MGDEVNRQLHDELDKISVAYPSAADAIDDIKALIPLEDNS